MKGKIFIGTIVMIGFILLIVGILFKLSIIKIGDTPEFVDVRFYALQPAEGYLTFKSNGYVIKTDQEEEYKYLYTYNKENNVIKFKNTTIKVLHYNKDIGFIYAYYNDKPVIIRTENAPQIKNLFISTDEPVDDNLNIGNQDKEAKIYIACLKGTDLCNFLKKENKKRNMVSVFEIRGEELVAISS